MIYTIGHRESYTRYFQEQERPLKLGRTYDYSGGSVWKTEEEARENCPDVYEVYGVMADWETDTEPSKEGGWHDLLINAELIQLYTPQV
jgi:hypothetical protein